MYPSTPEILRFRLYPLFLFLFFHFFIFLYGPFKCPFIRLKIHKTIEIKIFKNEYSYAES